ncbi:hypothetical protein [Amycolatopsis keratiniphila]|uniref:Excreted virulence factor EspC, type VII ESX diderm n=1 Tax=Amycolatopsis keratiniphila subsp. keratiniphila TaxID=227715 RepID=A0A1W2LYW0_9PSEU|nr:hypothetical protein [Amycolatopsis keratiniphila]OLZ50914.1 hypothetical protein BS330_28560 [Amycolatopsis keratiniphila subsp. nogabecina]ONF72100.1 hypothetical protein AVR91_0211155 [Amycolatopsis keratiniphila subsp. keratiniphila]SDU44867.1 hypothetical protein SAMN04489733_4407 [Amycolatopsis keratiniphila]
MTRRFDPEQIAALAKKVGGLKDGYTGTGKDLGDGDPGAAFGDLKNAAGTGTTIKGFHRGVNAELAAAAKLVDAASNALANAAQRMRNDEAAGVDTLRGNARERD